MLNNKITLQNAIVLQIPQSKSSCLTTPLSCLVIPKYHNIKIHCINIITHSVITKQTFIVQIEIKTRVCTCTTKLCCKNNERQKYAIIQIKYSLFLKLHYHEPDITHIIYNILYMIILYIIDNNNNKKKNLSHILYRKHKKSFII